jgi:Capsule polysaccharide biosynthesis protein
MRFLFTTLQTYESEFYGRVGRELASRGHEIAHLTVSRASARGLRELGFDAECLPDVIAALPPAPVAEEVARIEAAYEIPHIRDVYRTDWTCDGKPESWCIERTVSHFRALEEVFDRVRPDVLVPEVGNETIRVASHLIGLERGVPVLFLFHTIFPNPLRLYVDTMHAPIVPPDELRELTTEEVLEVEDFRRSFIERARPIRDYRRVPIEMRRVRLFADHLRRRHGIDRDNEYLRPWRLLRTNATERLRAGAARPFYGTAPKRRPYVYFPLHVTDDYKIKKIIPHCYDQASIVEQIADALPAGYDLVLKEHPMSIGRNSVRLLRRLRKRANVHLVSPFTNTHDLIRGSEAVAVISSTVGLEALLYDKPVLTLGEPFYSGYGITLDLRSFAEIREGVPALLRFRPDPEQIRRFLHAAMHRCYPGSSVMVDRSDANARQLADSIERAGSAVISERLREPA